MSTANLLSDRQRDRAVLWIRGATSELTARTLRSLLCNEATSGSHAFMFLARIMQKIRIRVDWGPEKMP